MSHVPEPIEVRKVPIHSVADASELAKLIDDGVMEGGGEQGRDHAQTSKKTVSCSPCKRTSNTYSGTPADISDRRAISV